MAGHARYSPSASKRWMNCPASIWLSEGLESGESDASREGTLAHDVAAKMLEGKWSDGRVTEMSRYAKAYRDYVISYIKGARVYVETRVDLTHFAEGLAGTCDAYSVVGDTLHVFDYKYGKRFVSADDNPQLMIYAYGVLTQCDPMPSTVVMHIYQPRAGDDPGRYSELSAGELCDFAIELAGAIEATKVPNAPAIEGEWCTFCPAKLTCPALTSGFDLISAPADLPLRDVLQGADLGDLLRAVGPARRFADAIEAHAYAMAAGGNPPRGWKLVEGKMGPRRWIDIDESAIAGELQNYGIEPYVSKLLTAPQAEAAMGKNKFAAMADYVERKKGAPVLVPESDSRPPLSGSEGLDRIEAMSE